MGVNHCWVKATSLTANHLINQLRRSSIIPHNNSVKHLLKSDTLTQGLFMMHTAHNTHGSLMDVLFVASSFMNMLILFLFFIIFIFPSPKWPLNYNVSDHILPTNIITLACTINMQRSTREVKSYGNTLKESVLFSLLMEQHSHKNASNKVGLSGENPQWRKKMSNAAAAAT